MNGGDYLAIDISLPILLEVLEDYDDADKGEELDLVNIRAELTYAACTGQARPRRYSMMQDRLRDTDRLQGYRLMSANQREQLRRPARHSNRLPVRLRNHAKSTYPQPDFVCSANTLQLLMEAWWENDEERQWKIYATKRGDTWHFVECRSHIADRVPLHSKYAAYMFELLMTDYTSVRQAARVAARRLFDQKQTSRIVSAHFCGYQLLYCGEIDCVDDDDNPIQLKTTVKWRRKPRGRFSIDTRTLRRTWAKAYLLGVAKIFIGFLKYTDGKLKVNAMEKVDSDGDVRAHTEPKSDWFGIKYDFASLSIILNNLKRDIFFERDAVYELRLDCKENYVHARKIQDLDDF